MIAAHNPWWDTAVLVLAVYGIVFYAGWCCGRGWRKWSIRWPVTRRRELPDPGRTE